MMGITGIQFCLYFNIQNKVVFTSRSIVNNMNKDYFWIQYLCMFQFLFMSVLMQIYCFIILFAIYFKIRIICLAFIFLKIDYFSIFLWFYKNFRIIFPIHVKNFIEILIRINFSKYLTYLYILFWVNENRIFLFLCS